MSLFRDSKSITEIPDIKVLYYGPEGVGKTHEMLSFPDLAVLDMEGRLGLFAQRSEFAPFKVAGTSSLADVRLGFKEILAGSIPCKSVGMDSLSGMYLQLVVEHTKLSDKGNAVTDWVIVNRKFLAFLDFIFKLRGKNIVCTAHRGDKYERKMVNGFETFNKVGTQIVSDDRIRYGFDFIIRLDRRDEGFIEKSVSPNIPVGSVLKNPSYQTLVAAIRRGSPPANGHAVAEKPKPAPAAENGHAQPSASAPPAGEFPPAREEQKRAITSICQQRKIKMVDMLQVIEDVTQGRAHDVDQLYADEAGDVIAALQKLVKV